MGPGRLESLAGAELVAETTLRAYDEADPERIDAYYAPDATYTNSTGDVGDRAALVDNVRLLSTAFAALETSVEETVEDGRDLTFRYTSPVVTLARFTASGRPTSPSRTRASASSGTTATGSATFTWSSTCWACTTSSAGSEQGSRREREPAEAIVGQAEVVPPEWISDPSPATGRPRVRGSDKRAPRSSQGAGADSGRYCRLMAFHFPLRNRRALIAAGASDWPKYAR
jgi:hypothetical protein